MEYSSPLAAMRPQPCPTWGRNDYPAHGAMINGYHTLGPNSFNFKDMSMHQKPMRDYFTLRPVRGSSPTSSLTADLDANFHIDKSPQMQTPRRSLFSANIFKPIDDSGRLATPPIEPEGATTPDIPSSSPGIDAMDISPLPHKAPYFVAQVILPSPSPEETPDESSISPDLLSPWEATTPQPCPLQAPGFLQLPERRRPVTRPSLSQTKGYSTNYIPHRPNTAENPLPPFRFGNVATTGVSCSSTPSLIESFTESPVELVPPPNAPSMLPPPRRPSLGSASRSTGSPLNGHIRKPSVGRAPFSRPPRKQMRRSLSMFQRPEDIMREEQDAFEPQPIMSSMMEVEQEPPLKLPHFVKDDDADGLPRITQETMFEVLSSEYNSQYDKIVIIDCRFEYEYKGGHIESAVNFNDKQLLTEKLFSELPPPATLLIFHCEYSVHRAPLTAKFIRSHDRTTNMANYPMLTYPEMYILDGGYSEFFSTHRSKCYPQDYVEMNDQRHEQACERGMAKVKQRQKLFRHQTFAFGQNTADVMEDSPTAQGRGMGPRSQSTFSVGQEITDCIGQSYARRMASY